MWLAGVCIVAFSLWVLAHKIPDGVRFMYLLFMGIGLVLSLLKMKRVLKYDGEFLYVISIRFFVRNVSCKIRMKDITDIVFLPDFWYKDIGWDILRYKFSELPKEERTVWNFFRLNWEIVYHFIFWDKSYFSPDYAKVQDIYKHLKVCLMHNGKKTSFAVKRKDEVWQFLCHMKENSAVS